MEICVFSHVGRPEMKLIDKFAVGDNTGNIFETPDLGHL